MLATPPLSTSCVSHAPYRPCLSWRDVQALTVYTAVKVDAEGAVWITNSAGLTHSDQHGFGLMDAYRLVTSAAMWPLLPAMVMATVEGSEAVALTTEPLVQNVTGDGLCCIIHQLALISTYSLSTYSLHLYPPIAYPPIAYPPIACTYIHL